MVYQAQRFLGGKSKSGWSERWGHLNEEAIVGPGDKPVVWVHAVSAGEVVAAVPILRELKAIMPEYRLVLSVTTPAGKEMAEQQASPYVAAVFYAPFDLFWVVRRVVSLIRPIAYVSLESELWPNLLHTLKSTGCKNVMVNGRMSERSHRRVMRYARPVFSWMLSNMHLLLVQGEADASRFRSLLPTNRASDIRILGNSKFDQEIVALSSEQVLHLKHSLHIPDVARVFVAGSTRSSEEEAVVLDSYQEVLKSFPDLFLIVAPRQISRAGELLSAMKSRGLNAVLKTDIESLPTSQPVSCLILNTMGELANIYAVATITFVGNSFPPVVKGGGQNLLQPLAHGKPVLYGPKIATIRSEADLSQQAGVGFQVQTVAELVERTAAILADTEGLVRIQRAALHLIASNRGVSARYACAVLELLHETGASTIGELV